MILSCFSLRIALAHKSLRARKSQTYFQISMVAVGNTPLIPSSYLTLFEFEMILNTLYL
jgi:hypothetical protein